MKVTERFFNRYEFGPVRAGTVTHRARMFVVMILNAAVALAATWWINQPAPTARPVVHNVIVLSVTRGHLPIKAH